MKRKNKFSNWLKHAVRIVSMHPKSFEQYWVLNVNRLQLFSFIGLVLLTFFGVFYLLFGYTGLGDILPSSFGGNARTELIQTVNKIEKLESQVTQQNQYIQNLQQIILGKMSMNQIYNDSTQGINEDKLSIDSTISAEQQLLAREVEERNYQNDQEARNKIEAEHFLIDPLRGTISQNFNENEHTGVDIIAEKNSPIMAIYKGQIIYSGYDQKDGNCIILSHPNGLTSIYKHCEKLFVSVGQVVNGGDPIAVIGNSGERSTGPHLHFEIWGLNGPLNPMDYFSFK